MGCIAEAAPGAAEAGGAHGRNHEEEAAAEAHKQRVEAEANTYLQAEIRKVEARAATSQVCVVYIFSFF
jgi:hypothetical protein